MRTEWRPSVRTGVDRCASLLGHVRALANDFGQKMLVAEFFQHLLSLGRIQPGRGAYVQICRSSERY